MTQHHTPTSPYTVDGKRVLVTGGTGSLGQAIVRRLLSGEIGRPKRVLVFSRDEAKQHQMRLDFQGRAAATDDAIYRHSRELLTFQIGDVRDPSSLLRALRHTDVVVHAAALKQVPTCEYFPHEAVLTNVIGTHNLVNAICHDDTPVERVLGISTDKACKPINVMGMTKALQERLLIEANHECQSTAFLCVRYGNVIASRGSVVPLFISQIRSGGPVTLTLPEMTRFMLSLDRAVDAAFAALTTGERGDTYVPKVPATRLVDAARALMILEGRDVPMIFTGIRPGEKVHEIMVSEDECFRTGERDGYYVILPVIPELRASALATGVLGGEYSSRHENVGIDELCALFRGSTTEIAAFA